MAETPRPADFPALPAFAPEKYYRVRVYRTVEWAERHFTAADQLTLRGDIAQQIAAAIYTAEETTPP